MDDMNLATSLEDLRQRLPEPFALSSQRDVVRRDPVTQKLLSAGNEAAKHLLSWLESNPEPSLARVALLVLAFFPPESFYQDLLGALARIDQEMAAAFEPGLWWIDLPAERIARDLVNLVRSSGNPNPLLLLQRPAAKEVQADLRDFVAERKMPLSLYALYALKSLVTASDLPLLRRVAGWLDLPRMSSQAGLYLLDLGYREGLEGILAGLLAPDEELRSTTYYLLARHLPREAVESAGYHPLQTPESLEKPARALLRFLIGPAGEVASEQNGGN
jgi:hypothetical protein